MVVILKKIILFIVFILFSSSLLGQYNNSKLSAYVNTFRDAKIASKAKIQDVIDENQGIIDKLTPLSLKTGALSKYIDSLPLKDFLDIIDKRNKAYEEDLFKPIEFWRKHDEELVNRKFARDSIRFGIYEGILRTRLKELYGEVIADLILTPILLKVKIIRVKNEAYKINDDQAVGQKIITAKVQDILKGGNYFNVGENIKFYYMPFWTNTENYFSRNDSYFISLFAIIDNTNGKRRFALDVNDVNGGITKISNDTLIDKDNYYGFGKISWKKFKSKIFSSTNINRLKGE